MVWVSLMVVCSDRLFYVYFDNCSRFLLRIFAVFDVLIE